MHLALYFTYIYYTFMLCVSYVDCCSFSFSSSRCRNKKKNGGETIYSLSLKTISRKD